MPQASWLPGEETYNQAILIMLSVRLEILKNNVVSY